MRGRSGQSFFERFFCCGNSSEVSQPQTKFKTIEDYLKLENKDPKLYILQLRDGYHLDKAKKVKTIHPLKELRFSNKMEEPNQYSCPICFRYFNYILSSQCCNNYICHICALEYKSPKCHFCQNEQCQYRDVDAKELKIYSDSQGMQMYALLNKVTTIS